MDPEVLQPLGPNGQGVSSRGHKSCHRGNFRELTLHENKR